MKTTRSVASLKLVIGASVALFAGCANDQIQATSDDDTSSGSDTGLDDVVDDSTTGSDDADSSGGGSADESGGSDATAGDTTAGEDSSSDGDAMCGNDSVEATEVCDGTDLDAENCRSQGFDAGTLACNADCSAFDTTACVTFSCGNDTIEGAEVCDGTGLDGEDCVSQGFDAGTLACLGDCTDFDATACVTFSCGNDTIEGAEVCDGTDLDGEDCVSQGFDLGVLACAAGCAALDTSGCINTMCGDDATQGAEVCDGTDLNGEDCTTQGFDAGTLDCLANCTNYDTTGCITFACGNDIAEGAEACDGVDHVGQDCISLGFDAGGLACAGDCSGFDTSGCITFAGDCCADNGTPGCDDGACTAAICAADPFCCDMQWDGVCAAAAIVEPACQGVGGTCANCGDDLAEGPEACDGTDLGGEDCISLGFESGVLACAADCSGLDTSACVAYVGDCCSAHGSPGCEDPGCTAAVCAANPFCCDTAWIGPCGDLAETELACQGVGGSCPDPICGDDVVGGAEVCDGADLAGENCVSQGFDEGTLACAADCTGYDTSACSTADLTCQDEDIGSTTGPAATSGSTTGDDDDLAPSCGAASGPDRAIVFTAPADDTYAFDTIGSGYDTKLALFSECDDASELICNDDFAGNPLCGGFPCSQVSLAMTAGQTVIVLVDGFNGDNGAFTLNITQGAICGNNIVEVGETCDGTDLGGEDCATQGFDGGVLSCLGDCSAIDTTGCSDFAGDCCSANGTPGCDDPTCTATICAADPFCCNTQWDGICATAATGEADCQGVGGTCP